jgi:hypothetical protein
MINVYSTDPFNPVGRQHTPRITKYRPKRKPKMAVSRAIKDILEKGVDSLWLVDATKDDVDQHLFELFDIPIGSFKAGLKEYYCINRFMMGCISRAYISVRKVTRVELRETPSQCYLTQSNWKIDLIYGKHDADDFVWLHNRIVDFIASKV